MGEDAIVRGFVSSDVMRLRPTLLASSMARPLWLSMWDPSGILRLIVQTSGSRIWSYRLFASEINCTTRAPSVNLPSTQWITVRTMIRLMAVRLQQNVRTKRQNKTRSPIHVSQHLLPLLPRPLFLLLPLGLRFPLYSALSLTLLLRPLPSRCLLG